MMIRLHKPSLPGSGSTVAGLLGLVVLTLIVFPASAHVGANDNNRNILTKTITADTFNATQDYLYDDVNRLLSVDEGWSRAYTYDPYGNRAATGEGVSGVLNSLIP